MFLKEAPPILHIGFVCSMLLSTCFALQHPNQTIHGPTPSPNHDGRDVDYELDGPSQDNLTLTSAGSNVDPENSSSLESDSMPTYFKPSTALAVFVLIGAFFSIGILALYTQHCTERNETNESAHQYLNFYSRGFLGSSLYFHPVVSQHHRSTSQLVTGLPTLQFPKDQALRESDITITTQDFTAVCVVCLNAVEEGEELRSLPNCRHSFHRDCIDKWLFSHATCPLCRRIIADNRKEECAVSAIPAQSIMQSPL
ncbi:hypothetical protein L7F22_036847 [Adiantum nelumboides]|nr:hypothetical protein [Adiantum nelumboides]